VPRPGLRKIKQYSEEFKATAVGLSSLRGVLIQDVAHSLDIHPFMLSRCRKEVREGKIVTKRVNVEPQRKAELKRLREIERQYELLKQEHAILKKAIRFASERKQKSSSSSKQTGRSIRSR
jgi:transposase